MDKLMESCFKVVFACVAIAAALWVAAVVLRFLFFAAVLASADAVAAIDAVLGGWAFLPPAASWAIVGTFAGALMHLGSQRYRSRGVSAVQPLGILALCGLLVLTPWVGPTTSSAYRWSIHYRPGPLVPGGGVTQPVALGGDPPPVAPGGDPAPIAPGGSDKSEPIIDKDVAGVSLPTVVDGDVRGNGVVLHVNFHISYSSDSDCGVEAQIKATGAPSGSPVSRLLNKVGRVKAHGRFTAASREMHIVGDEVDDTALVGPPSQFVFHLKFSEDGRSFTGTFPFNPAVTVSGVVLEAIPASSAQPK